MVVITITRALGLIALTFLMLVLSGIHIFFVVTEFNIQGLYDLVHNLIYVGIAGVFAAIFAVVAYRIYKGELS